MVQQPSLGDKPTTIYDRFLKFHHENPAVYQAIVEVARTMKGRGVKKMGIALIFERLRWLHFIETKGSEQYKLSNDFRAEYARLIMDTESDLEDFFNTRALRRNR